MTHGSGPDESAGFVKLAVWESAVGVRTRVKRTVRAFIISKDLVIGRLALVTTVAVVIPGIHLATHGGEASAVKYTDITQASGIRFRNNNSATPEKYLIETMTGGVAIFDYDNDGWPDVFLVNGARIHPGQRDDEIPDKSAPEFWNRLYHNNHNGTFTDVTERAAVRGYGYGMGAAVGDYDNDGFDDLLVTNYG